MKIGVIGCGDVSRAYMRLAPRYAGLEPVACADRSPEAAERRGRAFGLEPMSVDALLAAPDIELVVNLTPPNAHFEISARALEAGKHVYSEKPFALSLDDGERLIALASARDLRIGSAPDTFLGGAHQCARALIDAGAIGEVTGGSCHAMSAGMESWHPNPDFFFQPGGGPILDLGPYFLVNLVQLLGPARRVCALASRPSETRVIGSGPRAGESVAVGAQTTFHALLEFEQGALITLSASWDVRAHGHPPMELYGREGSMRLADPNFFGGDVLLSDGRGWTVQRFAHPFGQPNEHHQRLGWIANHRTCGLADMVRAIETGAPHRCDHALALHALEALLAIERSARAGRAITLRTRCERPAPLSAAQAVELIAPAGVPDRGADGRAPAAR